MKLSKHTPDEYSALTERPGVLLAVLVLQEESSRSLKDLRDISAGLGQHRTFTYQVTCHRGDALELWSKLVGRACAEGRSDSWIRGIETPESNSFLCGRFRRVIRFGVRYCLSIRSAHQLAIGFINGQDSVIRNVGLSQTEQSAFVVAVTSDERHICNQAFLDHLLEWLREESTVRPRCPSQS